MNSYLSSSALSWGRTCAESSLATLLLSLNTSGSHIAGGIAPGLLIAGLEEMSAAEV